MLKKILKVQLLGVLLIGANLVANTQSACDNLRACKKKICSIEKNIAIAKKMENKSRVKGLEISLEKVNKYCTDEKLIEDLKDKIKDTKKELKKDTKDYEEALKENRPSKIEKYKSKMSEENTKIKRLEQELKELQ